MRAFRLLLIFCIFTTAPVRAQKLAQVLPKIQREVERNSEAYDRLGEATRTIGHRLTGSANGARAEQYAYDLLRKYGFKDVQFQPFEVEAWSRDSVTLEVLSGAEHRHVPVVSLAHSPVQAQLQGELVDVGSGLRKDFERVKDKVRGKIALFYIAKLPEDKDAKNLHRSEKTALAIEYGATGVVIYNQVPDGVLLTGTASVTGELIPIPAVCIGFEDGQQLRAALYDKPVTVQIRMRNRSELIRARNVVATLRGSEKPDEMILIGGHLDSWDLATGAIDNGIGSFAVIDIARTFQKLKLKPKRTVQFVLFMGEEEGLLGSKALVQERLRQGTLDKVKLMLNLDMSGNPIGFTTNGRPELEPLVREIGSQIAALDSAFDNKVDNKAGLHSDHQTFLLEGIPALQPLSNLDRSVYACYHSDCDDFGLVNKRHLERTVSTCAMMLYSLASAPAIPAKRLSPTATRDFFIEANLKEELKLGKEWRWEE